MGVRAEENRDAREFRRGGGDPKRRTNVAREHDDSIEFSRSYEPPDAGVDQPKESADCWTRRNILELHPRIVIEKRYVPDDLDAESGVNVRLGAFQAAVSDQYFELGTLRHKAPHGRAVLNRVRSHKQDSITVSIHSQTPSRTRSQYGLKRGA